MKLVKRSSLPNEVHEVKGVKECRKKKKKDKKSKEEIKGGGEESTRVVRDLFLLALWKRVLGGVLKCGRK
jgi:hypothetical protein